MVFKKDRQTNNGFTLLFAVLVTAIVLTIGLTVGDLVIKEIVLSQSVRDSQRAFSAADAAAECALYWDQVHPGLSQSAFGGSTGSVITNGLVAHWRLNDPSGSTEADDSSPNDYDGTLVNMDPNTDWVDGRKNGALDFDGSNDYVAIQDLFYNSSIGEVTVCSWIKTTALQGGIADFDRSDYWSLALNFHGASGKDGTISWDTRGVNEGIDDMNSSVTVNNGGWQHVCAVYDNAITNDKKIYLNGSLDVEKDAYAIGEALGSTNTRYGFLGIGSEAGSFNGGTNTNYLAGVLDDVRIYNRALTDAEIADIANLTEGEFNNPISQNSNITCEGADISDPSTGWDSANGWDILTESEAATTTFDIAYNDGTCATIVVEKFGSGGTISSRGYNTCNLNNPRRVERGLRVDFSPISQTGAPLLNLTASPTTVDYDGSTTLTWTVSNADSCAASGAWSGSKDPNGNSETVSNLTSDSTFILDCTGPGGTSQDSVFVAVGDPPVPPPTVSLTASPDPVDYNNPTTLSWSSTDADSCTATGGVGFSTGGATSGNDSSSNLTADEIFSISCTNAAGTANDNVLVNVNAETHTLTISKNSDNTGGSGTVTGPGINCGSDCSETYEDGTSVTLSASPAANSAFGGWSGDCDSSGNVTMTADRSCTATFRQNKLIAVDYLRRTEQLKSQNGTYSFNFQGDENLVANPGAYWASHTNGTGADRLYMGEDGNLVLYDINTSPWTVIWTSQSGGGPTQNYFLVIRNGGRIAIMNPDNTLYHLIDSGP